MTYQYPNMRQAKIHRQLHIFFPIAFLLISSILTANALSSSSSSGAIQHDTSDKSNKGWTRRDVFQKSTAAIGLASSTFGILGGNAGTGNALEPSADSIIADSSTISDLPYLLPEYYNNAPSTAASKGRFYFPTLTPPYQNRATYRYDLGKDMWAFEQLLTFSNVSATIKTTVVRLESGGLWVHSPQWPTGEFCHLLDELCENENGSGSPGVGVEHIVLPCNAFEHAAPVKAFCKKYPKASVWVSPGQYGPFGSCGTSMKDPYSLGYKVDGIFGANSNSDTDQNQPSWIDEFDYTTLYVNLPENAGPASEVAFFHKKTKTFIATDALVYIDDKPSPIFSTYFDQETISNPSFWPKTVLQSVFLPLRVDEESVSNENNNENGNRSIRYPGYESIQGRLLRAPALRGFNDARAPVETREWINDVAHWDFDRIVTSHFASPIAANPTHVKSAFSFLNGDEEECEKDARKLLPPIACKDWEVLDGLNDFIATNKIAAPAIFFFFLYWN